MKKSLFILSAGCFLFFTSCNDKKDAGGISAKAKKNMEANDAIMKMFETNDWSKIGDYIAADAVDHAGPKGDIKGLDSLKGYFANMGKMMTNMKNDIIKTLADDEYVMTWMKGSSTAKEDMPEWGMKAGQSHTGHSVEVSKFKEGKVVEHWSFVDANEMMQMMGGIPPPPIPMNDKMGPPVKDSTSK